MASVELLAALELLRFRLGGLPEQLIVDAECLDHLLVDDPDAAARHRAHRELLAPRHADLPNDEYVERGPESESHLLRDGNPSARQGEHDDVVSPRECHELLGEPPACVDPIPE